MTMQCLAVALGGAVGAVGAVGRYLLGLAPFLHRGDFPFATLLVNLLGAFFIGLIAEAAAEKGLQNGAGAAVYRPEHHAVPAGRAAGEMAGYKIGIKKSSRKASALRELFFHSARRFI